MEKKSINRKQFLTSAGKYCAGVCLCAAVGSLNTLHAQEPTNMEKETEKKPRSEERINFAEGWVKRFFDVIDTTLDEPTRQKLMMANGRACLLAWYNETGRKVKPVTLEKFIERIKSKVKDGSYRIDGNTIYFQYMSAAETGLPSDDAACLCPLVETKPAGLSDTYCYCSVGYVKEMHEQYLGRQVNVELLDSVLKGGKRCRFKLTMA
ncbi:exported hypothetical protein [Candidatus Zixiibacteriota bacterium]|nr:exported hypothetical protein [candidate division Zixibacteria bacterium]